MLITLPPDAKLQVSKGIDVAMQADGTIAVQIRHPRRARRVLLGALCIGLVGVGSFLAGSTAGGALAVFASANPGLVNMADASEAVAALQRAAPQPRPVVVMPPVGTPAAPGVAPTNDPFGLGD